MWWLKLSGCLLVFLGCGYIGIERTRALKNRICLLREMMHALNLFKSLAETYRLPMEILFEKIYPQVTSPASDFYKKLYEDFKRQEGANGVQIWQNNVRKMGKAFDKEDQMLFLNLGDFLGIQDIRMQTAAVENCIDQMRQRLEVLEKERPEKEKLYKVLSFTVSGFLILLFI